MSYKNGVKYPVYSHDEKLSTKIAENDIPTIRKMFFVDGLSQSRIALEFGVSRATIRYWLKDDDGRKLENQKRLKRSRKGYVAEQHKQFLSRKKEVKTEETREYRNSVNRGYKKNNLDRVREKDREYHRRKRSEK